MKDLVGQRLDIGLIMRDQDRRDIDVALQLSKLFPHARPQTGIQGRQGFVQQQQSRIGGQRPRQGHALALAAGQFGRIAIQQRSQTKGLDPALSTGRQVAAAMQVQPPMLQTETDILAHRQMGKQRIVLKQIGQPPTARRHVHPRPGVEQDPSGNLDTAPVGAQEPRDGLHRQALARTGRAEQRHAPGIGAPVRLQQETVVAADAALDIDRQAHDALRAPAPRLRPLGINQDARHRMITQVAEVTSTRILAVSSLPAWTAS